MKAIPPKPTILSWSSGKDSAWALHVLRRDPAVELVGLVSTVNERYDRVAMHATRVDLLRRQARAAGLPLEIILLPDPCSDEQYAQRMQHFVDLAITRRVEAIAFGDLFLEDIRRYREEQLRGSGLDPLFPVWGRETRSLADEMLAEGLEAYVSSVDLAKLPVSVAGRKWNRELLAQLPPGCDPCGENGELHTIVAAGPMFREPIPVRVGEVVQRDGFAYADVVLDGEGLGIRD
ncbi:MAG: adenine nucleotide alpha hydrolase [Pirellulales bacterium]|nr:adenine nucleotide alpha hydrolase [Pirellulales bacterium]